MSNNENNSSILETLRENEYSWTVRNDKITFKCEGESCTIAEIKRTLRNLHSDVTYSELEELIKDEADNSVEKGSGITYKRLPTRNALYMDDNLTPLDHKLFEDIKFEHLADGSMVFAVKDSDEHETYTRIPASSDTSGTIDSLTKAFIDNPKANPHYKMKILLRELEADCGTDIDQLSKRMPTCLYPIVDLKYVNDSYAGMNLKPDYDVFYQYLKYKRDFMFSKEHTLPKRLRNLTNDPNEPALAYCDLKKLHDEYYDKPSALWDSFLLERFHSESALSIFKAWCYAVFVGDNNSRQEMWLYGQGGTGKGCIQHAFVEGFKKLCGKNLVIAMSKDSGKSNFNSELLNKHLGIYADAKNLKQGMSEQHQNVTGGDIMRIEGKGLQAVSANVYLKLLTFSNEKPQCSMTDRAQSSRYIILPFGLTDEEMKTADLMDEYGQLIGSNTFKYRLEDEFPNFIASCEDHYKRRCPRNSNIDAHEFLSEIQTCELTENELADDFIEKYFIIDHDKDSYITAKDFANFVTRELSDLQRVYHQAHGVTLAIVRDRLQRVYNIKSSSKRTDGKVVNAYIGIKHNPKVTADAMYTAQEVEEEDTCF